MKTKVIAPLIVMLLAISAYSVALAQEAGVSMAKQENDETHKLALPLVFPQGSDALHIYVAPNGDDGSPGTIEQPLRSFKGARNKVRTLIDGSGDITVYFREGTYVFDTMVVLGPADSGSANQKITYAAYPGETPVFSSLVKVTGWRPYDGNIIQADLPAGISHVRYLHDESETWMSRSSTSFFRPDFVSPYGGPEAEHWEPDAQQRKTYTIYPASFPMPDPSKGAQYDLRSHMTAWNAQVLPVSGVDVNARRINVATPSHYSLVNGLDDIQTEVWILNSIEGIDQPGEWASLDGKIYLYPASGTDDIFVPTLTELIRVDGGGDGNTWSGTPVQYIHFDGLTFTGADYRISEANDVMAQHDWQMVDVPEGLLRFRNASNSSVKNSIFTKAGSDAVRLDRYAQNIIIEGCEFSYLGKGGVVMSGRGPGYGDVNNHNVVINSHFKQTSRIKWDAAAIHLDQSSSNLIKQTFFEDIPLSAIIVSGNRESNIAEAEADPINRDFHFAEIRPDLIEDWEGSSTEFYDHDNLIEENTFRAVHIGTPELIPAVNNEAPGFTNGMIYTTGRQAGGTDTFRKNYFYDVDALPTYSHTWVILGDGHEDYLDFHQNMAYNLQQINGFEDPPFMSINCNLSGGCRATANVKLNSPYSEMECPGCQNASYAGNIDFDSGAPGGSAAYVAEYQEMWALLCPGSLPGPTPLPGAVEMQTNLAGVITRLGGTVPSCDSFPDHPSPTPSATPASTATPIPTVTPTTPPTKTSTPQPTLTPAPTLTPTATTTQTPTATPTVPKPPAGFWTKVDDRDEELIYTGPWEEVEYDTAYMGTVNWIGEEDAEATYTFTGSKARVYVWQFEEDQNFELYVDNRFAQIVDVAAGGEGSYLAWESESLTPGAHTIRVQFGGTELHLDAIEYFGATVTPAPPPTATPSVSVPPSDSWIKVDDSSDGFVYTGFWEEVEHGTAYLDTLAWTDDEEAAAAYTFTGTKVRVYVWRFEEDQDFNVYLDGQFEGTVDVAAGDERSNLAWESDLLTPGNHTVRIRYNSTELHLDALEYYGIPAEYL